VYTVASGGRLDEVTKLLERLATLRVGQRQVVTSS